MATFLIGEKDFLTARVHYCPNGMMERAVYENSVIHPIIIWGSTRCILRDGYAQFQ